MSAPCALEERPCVVCGAIVARLPSNFRSAPERTTCAGCRHAYGGKLHFEQRPGLALPPPVVPAPLPDPRACVFCLAPLPPGWADVRVPGSAAHTYCPPRDGEAESRCYRLWRRAVRPTSAERARVLREEGLPLLEAAR